MIMNYDQCLRFRIEDKRISLIDEMAVEVVADNRNNICCKFECDEQWDEVAKVARFIYNGQWKDVMLDADCMCYVPPEVIKEGRFSVGLYGDNLKASTPLVVTVLESILSENNGELPDEPSEDIYVQILTMTADANAKADAATEAAWAAVDASTEAIKALNQAKQEMEEAGFLNTIKEKHTGMKLGFWVGTQAEYDALENKPTDCYVLISDDNTLDDILDNLDANRTGLESQLALITALTTKLDGLIKTGEYEGDATTDDHHTRFIELGFTPTILYVHQVGRASHTTTGTGGATFYSSLCIGSNTVYGGASIIENGFSVVHKSDSSTMNTDFELNTNGSKYIYIAINLGGV